jgi:DNA-binding winged helix-turn-helix (wHTH) protein
MDRVVCVHGKKVHFTPSEYSILEKLCLVAPSGELLKAEQFVDVISRAFNHKPQTETVRTHIIKIRKKLKNEGVTDFIKTRARFGYTVAEFTGGVSSAFNASHLLTSDSASAVNPKPLPSHKAPVLVPAG